MAQITQLSVNALPGKVLTFSAKTEAPPLGERPQITQLSVNALPGKVLTFSAKTEAPPPGERPQITQLSVNALPGKVLTFSAKAGSRRKRIRGVGVLSKVIGS